MGKIIGGCIGMISVLGVAIAWHMLTLTVDGYHQEEAFERFVVMYYLLGGLVLINIGMVLSGVRGRKKEKEEKKMIQSK